MAIVIVAHASRLPSQAQPKGLRDKVSLFVAERGPLTAQLDGTTRLNDSELLDWARG